MDQSPDRRREATEESLAVDLTPRVARATFRHVTPWAGCLPLAQCPHNSHTRMVPSREHVAARRASALSATESTGPV